jgi:hypothetical protein
MALTRRTKQGVTVLIIVLGILSAYLNNRNMNNLQQKIVDFSRVQRVFDTSENISKVKMEISVTDFRRNINNFDSLLAQYQIVHRRNEAVGSQAVYLLEVPMNVKKDFLAAIRKLGTVTVNNEETKTQEEEPNLAVKLADYQYLKQQVMSDIQKGKVTVDTRLNRIKDLQTTIDSLTKSIAAKEYNHRMSLVLLVITDISTPEQNVVGNALNFVKQALLYILLYTGVALIVYYGSRVLVSFLSFMGVRSSSTGGTYRYGHRYGYGYGNRKRKVKRIYKDKSDDTFWYSISKYFINLYRGIIYYYTNISIHLITLYSVIN